jgi:hypothetical protein
LKKYKRNRLFHEDLEEVLNTESSKKGLFALEQKTHGARGMKDHPMINS